jgi:hypothetical protein
MEVMMKIALHFFVLTAFSFAMAFRIQGQEVTLGGVKVTALVPSVANLVTVNPYKLEPIESGAILHYRTLNSSGETVHSLRWGVYLTNRDNRILHQTEWWDRGSWNPKASDNSTVLIDHELPRDVKITMVLLEAETARGVWKSEAGSASAVLQNVIASGNVDLLKFSFEPHDITSEFDDDALMKKSFNLILDSEDLRQLLHLGPSDTIHFLDRNFEGRNDFLIERVTKIEVQTSIRNARPLTYFEYGGADSYGSEVTLTFDFHMPRMIGSSYVDEGIRLEFHYSRRKPDDFKLKDIKSSHF